MPMQHSLSEGLPGVLVACAFILLRALAWEEMRGVAASAAQRAPRWTLDEFRDACRPRQRRDSRAAANTVQSGGVHAGVYAMPGNSTRGDPR